MSGEMIVIIGSHIKLFEGISPRDLSLCIWDMHVLLII